MRTNNTVPNGALGPTRDLVSLARSFAEWFGSIIGILGALVLAANMPWSGYGWLAFLASNMAWITYAVIGKIKSLLVMQMVFMATSLLGAYRYLF